MAGLTADVVVVELEARMSQYTAAVSAAANRFAMDMSKITTSATKAEAATEAVGQGAATGLRRIPVQAQDAAQAIDKTKFATANLAAQFQDIGVMVAAGQSPFLLMLQQGTQVAAIMSMQEGGVGGALRGVGGALRSILSPVSLLSMGFVGLVAVAGSWLVDAFSDTQELEAATDLLADTVGRLRDVYGEAADAQRALAEEERLQRLADLTTLLATKTQDLNNLMENQGQPANLISVPGFASGRDDFRELEMAMMDFYLSARTGTADAQAFTDTINAMITRVEDPVFDAQAVQVRNWARGLLDAQQQVADLTDQVAILNETATDDAFDRQGLVNNTTRALEAMEAVLDRIGQTSRGGGGVGGDRGGMLSELREEFEAALVDLEEVAAVHAERVRFELSNMFYNAAEEFDVSALEVIRQYLANFIADIADGSYDVVAFRTSLQSLADLAPENAALQGLVAQAIALTDGLAGVVGVAEQAAGYTKLFGETAAATVKPVMDANWAIAQLKDMMGTAPSKEMILGIYEIGLAAATTAEQVAQLDHWLAMVSGRDPSAPPAGGIAKVLKPTPGSSGGGGMSDAEREAEQIERTIENLRFQAEQLGRTAREQAIYNALQRAGIDANHDMADEVSEAAASLYDQAEAIRQNQKEMEELIDVQLQFRDDAWNAFESFVTGAKTAKEAIRDLIKEMLIAEARALILNALTPGTANDVAPGPISAIFKLIAGVIGRNAEGTNNWRGGWSWVGEKGPELLNLPRGSQVIPNNRASQMGLGSLVFSPITHISADGAGVSRADIAAMLDRRDARLRDELPAMLQRHRSNRRIG